MNEKQIKARGWLWAGTWGLTLAMLGITGVIVNRVGGDALWLLKTWLVLAALVGAVGAGMRLHAHGSGGTLDGVGKGLGFAAAIIALCATGALFFINVTFGVTTN